MDIALLDKNGNVFTILYNVADPTHEVSFFSKMYNTPLTYEEYIPPEDQPTIDQLRQAKLDELNKAAANAYISGFSSAASGTSLWYDSDADTQNVINRQFLIALSSPTVYSSTHFFVGVPVGVTPVRARPQSTDSDSAKTIQLLGASQMVQLGNDLATAWAGVKDTLWSLQAKVYAAMTLADLDAITWPSSS